MILGIESSCDESALALLDPLTGFAGEWVHSQIPLHKDYGGVVPDLASREHLDNFPVLLDHLMRSWEPQEGDSIAVTAGPGLAGCLALGISMAKALGLALNLPVTGVNHLRGHAWSPFVDLHSADPVAFKSGLEELLPHLGCLVSGGNTALFAVEEPGRIRLLSETIDDAAGEALDKGGKLLGLPYPGGPLVEYLGAHGDSKAYSFPRSFLEPGEPRFSFSGLKTSLRYCIEKMTEHEVEERKVDLCASYQEAVVDTLTIKTEGFLKMGGWRSIGLSGGVSNNGPLRHRFGELAEGAGVPCLLARRGHTGDNAAMIAFAAWLDPLHCRSNEEDRLAFDPSWDFAQFSPHG